MSVPFSEVLEVRNHLRQQHIIVSSDWVEACIEFIKEDRAGQTISIQNMKNYVYEQWLVADLEEIKVSALPKNLSTERKITLKGSFALQIQGIRDISRPAYSQLNQIEGNTNSNAEFSSAPKSAVPEWEAKPTRMLMLNLTDGCTLIQGMEYKPINFLSPNLPPGVKVLIKGPIDCRFGVLLLTSEKIAILGGEVESKLQAFSREAVLKEVLQIPLDTENAEDSLPSNSENSQNMAQTSRNTQLNIRVNSGFSDNLILQDHSNTSNAVRREYPANSRNNNNFNNIDNFESDDDFEQNIDYGKLDEIENSQKQEELQSIPSENNNDAFDIWQEDEDVIQELFEFEDANPELQMPYEQLLNTENQNDEKNHQIDYRNSTPFTYLSVIKKDPAPNCVVTIKGFIITVVSKLECTVKGWSVIVKVNDGTASLDACIHDKVLENIIGISAADMVKMQSQASTSSEIGKVVMEAIRRCKFTLQNCNCLMDIKFTPDDKPCIIKWYPINGLHIQQLFDRICINV